MKRIIFIVLSAVVLTLVPATYACAQWKWKGDYNEGLAMVLDANNKLGFIDQTGKLVIPCQWKSVDDFHEGLARVYDDNEKYGFIDKTGKVVSPCKWSNAGPFSAGLARVQDANGKYGFIDKTGKVVLPCKWNCAYTFYEGLAAVKDASGKWGYINKTGKLVIPCQWELVGDFYEGLAEVEDDNGNKYTIDKKGKIVSSIPSTPSIDPNSMSWPSPDFDSGWKREGNEKYKKYVRWNGGGKHTEFITKFYYSASPPSYWASGVSKMYETYEDAEAAVYFYSVHGLTRTRGQK